MSARRMTFALFALAVVAILWGAQATEPCQRHEKDESSCSPTTSSSSSSPSSSCPCCCSSSGLTLKLYDNAALVGTPRHIATTTLAQLSLANKNNSTQNHASFTGCHLSGELSGSLHVSNSGGGIYTFDCQFHATSTGWVWVDGHLVCQDGNAYRPKTPDEKLLREVSP